MKQKTKLAVVGCLLLVGVVIVAVVTASRDEQVSLAFIGYTNNGVAALFQVRRPIHAVYEVGFIEVTKGVVSMTSYGATEHVSGQILAPVPEGTQSWRGCVIVYPAISWMGKTASRLERAGVPIPGALIDRMNTPQPFTNYSAEITR